MNDYEYTIEAPNQISDTDTVDGGEFAREYHDADCDCATCQTNDALGYDADVSDPKQYCRHGTFIGSWWGPDFLCTKCEMGDD
jgi:hypothetical protein